jgi:hypothetical protein
MLVALLLKNFAEHLLALLGLCLRKSDQYLIVIAVYSVRHSSVTDLFIVQLRKIVLTMFLCRPW